MPKTVKCQPVYFSLTIAINSVGHLVGGDYNYKYSLLRNFSNSRKNFFSL